MNLSAEWKQTENSLQREWKFKNFKAALAWVNTLGVVAEELKHHPDLRLGWGYVRVSITTHDAGNKLTPKDFELAQRIDGLPQS